MILIPTLPQCDVVIISDAKNEKLKDLTVGALDSLNKAKGEFHTIVVERQDVFYKANTICYTREDFNYNRLCNLGIRQGSNHWVCVSNNDVLFTENWWEELMQYNYDVMCPRCPKNEVQAILRGRFHGFKLHWHFSGWCFVLRRALWERIGGLNESFQFHYSDNIFLEQLKEIDVEANLICGSVVHHLKHQTLKTLDDDTFTEYTKVQEVIRKTT